MTTHPPFESARHLPADLALGFWHITTGLANDYWWHDARPWLARTLTRWGARLT